MKTNICLFIILIFATSTIKAQIPVTDAAANSNTTLNQIVNYSTWTKQLQNAITQSNILTTTLKYVQSVSSAVRDISYTKELISRQGKIVKMCSSILKRPRINDKTYRSLSSNVSSILATNNQLISLASSSLTGKFKMNDSERMKMLQDITKEQNQMIGSLNTINSIMNLNQETSKVLRKQVLK